MPSYSVADAKNGLPGLIDRALEGEEVVITRHGRPVAELRPLPVIDKSKGTVALDRLRAGRDAGPVLDITAVELLNLIYEDPAE